MFAEQDLLSKEPPKEELINSVKKLSLQPDLLAILQDFRGLPSPIFPENLTMIESLLAGKDVYVEGPSTAGRILSVLLCAAQLIDENIHECQALIVLPTREDCQKVPSMLATITERRKIKMQMLIGGTNLLEVRKRLQEKPQVIIGTPALLHDNIKREFFTLGGLKLVIIDNVNEMLFGDQMKGMLKYMPMDVQMGIFSGYSLGVQDFVELSLREPVSIVMKRREPDMKDVEHFKVLVKEEKEKMEFLDKLCSFRFGNRKSLVYCRTDEKMMEFMEALKKKGLNVVGIDSWMSSDERERARREFSEGLYQILVVGGLVPLGDIVSLVPLIIYYDVPMSKEDYIAGLYCSWNFGKKQIKINLVRPDDLWIVEEIESFYSIEMKELLEKDLGRIGL